MANALCIVYVHVFCLMTIFAIGTIICTKRSHVLNLFLNSRYGVMATPKDSYRMHHGLTIILEF